MPVFESERLDAIEDKVDGVFLGMEAGLRDIRKDVRYLGNAYLPLIALALASLVLSIVALVFAVENRSIVLQTANQTTKNTRDLEQIIPVIMQPYGPVPSEK